MSPCSLVAMYRVIDRTYAVGGLRLRQSGIFHKGVPLFALRAKVEHKREANTLLPQAKSGHYVGHRVSPVTDY